MVFAKLYMDRSQGTVSVYLNNPPKEVPPGLGKAPWVMMDRFMNCSDMRDEFLKKATGKFEFFSVLSNYKKNYSSRILDALFSCKKILFIVSARHLMIDYEQEFTLKDF